MTTGIINIYHNNDNNNDNNDDDDVNIIVFILYSECYKKNI